MFFSGIKNSFALSGLQPAELDLVRHCLYSLISSEPAISCRTLDVAEGYLLLGSDGFWDAHPVEVRRESSGPFFVF